MDTIDSARIALEAADDALAAAVEAGHSAAVCDELAQQVADLEGAYFRAVDMWPPAATR